MGYECDSNTYKRKIGLKGQPLQEIDGSFYLSDCAEQFVRDMYNRGEKVEEETIVMVQSIDKTDQWQDVEPMEYKVIFKMKPYFCARMVK